MGKECVKKLQRDRFSYIEHSSPVLLTGAKRTSYFKGAEAKFIHCINMEGSTRLYMSVSMMPKYTAALGIGLSVRYGKYNDAAVTKE